MVENPYDAKFFSAISGESLRSARHCVPNVLAVVQPKSVVDVGCGIGAFLSVFEQNNVTDFVGIDGDYVSAESLLISKEKFITADLSNSFDLHRKFDLAISLEVGEHLPIKSASTYVESLTKHAPVIWFSAALPGQGGTGHINEQWPSYWASLFADFGYDFLDCLRPLWMSNSEISWWYAQNSLLFVEKPIQDRIVENIAKMNASIAAPISYIHPRLHAARNSEYRNALANKK